MVTPTMEGKFLTVREAAVMKGVSREAVYAAVRDGRLPSRIELEKIALLEEDVAAWVPFSQAGPRKSSPMADEVKAKIAESQRKRWAKLKTNSDT